MKCFSYCLMAAILCSGLSVSAQEKSGVKFGKVSPEDFNIRQKFDTGTAAVVIADIGSSSFEGNTKGWFSLVYKHTRRVKLLTKNGFDAADVQIPLYLGDNGAEEKLTDLKANTYNLENGLVVQTRLDGGSVFKDKLSKHIVVRKFTFPAVKEGSIIEYSYTVNSDFFFNLQPWEFQGSYPRMWSEYTVTIPQFFEYVFLKQGYLPYYKEDVKNSFQNYNVVENGGTGASETYHISGTAREIRWVIKDVPALKEEKFTSAVRNHISMVFFQLSGYRFPNVPFESKMGNWVMTATDLLKREDFGEGLEKSNNWMEDDLKSVCNGAAGPLEKAQRIYAYVRDRFTCTKHSSMYMEAGLKQAFSKRSGNVADINLLLVAMLKHAGIESNPVILSTRENGKTYEAYPIIDRFNYVICQAVIDGKLYYLDASHPYLGFNRLDEECYNGHARVINATLPAAIYFNPDSLTEKKITSVFIRNSEKDKGKMEGSFQTHFGYFESAGVREALKSKGEEAYFKKIKSAYSMDITITGSSIDSAKQKEEPIAMSYDFSFDKPEDGMLYINPMMAEGEKENYFKDAERLYPVEMPYATDENYIFDMEIPEGYTVEEVPKSAKVSFNETDGLFEYLVDTQDGHIRLRSRVKLNKATFMPEEYESLRQFYGYVVKKHAEQIVLKKKS